MAGGCPRQCFFLVIKQAVKECHELVRLGILHKVAVQLGDGLRQIIAVVWRVVTQNAAGGNHEHGSRDAVAGDIPEHEADPAGGDGS